MSDHPILDERSLWSLETILAGVDADPLYLVDAPYPEWLKVRLAGRQMLGMAIDNIDLNSLDVMAEVEALFTDLKTERGNFGVKDSAEKMAYFRVSTSLLEKLVGLKERSNNVHQIGQFYAEVLSVMEQILTPAQASDVRTRLMTKMGDL